MEINLAPFGMAAVSNSSQVAETGYDAASRRLAVRFKSGGVYLYDNVPPDMVAKMGKADSVGKFLAAHIKGKYKHTQVKDKPDGKR